MESISKKIVDLEKKNIILKTDGLKLSYEAPKDKINKEILDFLKENKSEIIKLLLNDTTEKWNSMGIYESKSFPLTDTQAAYLMGREECFSYGNVGCHIYFEIEYSCLDFNQVQNVWNELLERHEMLRMEITADKKQIISEIVPKNIDTTNETEDQILSMVREKFGNKQYNIYKAPLFDVGVISREKKNDILFLSVFFLLSNLSTQDNIETSAYYSGETIAKVKALKSALMEQLDRKISLPELAEQYGLSLTMLKDCFKAVYGKPVHAFRREYKMQVATKLLTTTDMSITELAGEFGYENPNKFSTAFKEVIGVSPRAYRAKNK